MKVAGGPHLGTGSVGKDCDHVESFDLLIGEYF
jgi:hypothetical protein